MPCNLKASRLFWFFFASWMAAWFWAFSFAYSDSFFQYHRETRIPFFLLSWFTAGMLLLITYWSAIHFCAGKFTGKKAFTLNLLFTALPILLFAGIYAGTIIIGQMRHELILEADESMGVGIDLILNMSVYVLLNVVFGGSLIIRHFIKARIQD